MPDNDEGGGRHAEAAPPEVTAEILDRLEALPDDSRREMMAVLYQHRGPLPDPATFAAYGAAYADAPREILAMAQRQHEHDIAIASQAMTSEISYRRETLIAATLAFLSVVAAAAAAGITGHEITAGAIAGMGSVTFTVGVLLQGRNLFGRAEAPQAPPPAIATPEPAPPAPAQRPNRHQPRGRR